MGEFLKEKVHIINKRYKVTGLMKQINDNMSVEVGMGNDQINPKESSTKTYLKLKNTGDLDIQVRFSKQRGLNEGPSKEFVKLGPNEKYDAVEIYFTGKDSGNYALEFSKYCFEILSQRFQNSTLR